MKKKQILKNIEKNTKDSKSKGEKDVFFKFITTLVVLVLLGILVYFLIGVFYTKETLSLKKEKEELENKGNALKEELDGVQEKMNGILNVIQGTNANKE